MCFVSFAGLPSCWCYLLSSVVKCIIGNCADCADDAPALLRIPEEVCLSFISAQDHAYNHLLHALYAPRKRLSSTLGPRAVTGMRDAGFELPRISVPRTPVNKGMKKGRCCYAPARLVRPPL